MKASGLPSFALPGPVSFIQFWCEERWPILSRSWDRSRKFMEFLLLAPGSRSRRYCLILFLQPFHLQPQSPNKENLYLQYCFQARICRDPLNSVDISQAVFDWRKLSIPIVPAVLECCANCHLRSFLCLSHPFQYWYCVAGLTHWVWTARPAQPGDWTVQCCRTHHSM